MALTDLLLNQLKKKNPQGYQFVMQVRQSGRNPTDVMREMYQKGQLNDAQLNMIQKQGRLFGLNIPQSEISKIKAVENSPKINPQPKSKFGGWF